MKSTFFKKGVLKRGLATVMTAAMLAVEGLGAPGLAGVLTVQAAETTVSDASANVAFAADAETELKVGDEKDYALKITEYDASSNAINFKSFEASSSNKEVATVVASETEKKVTVKAVAAGEATITVTAKFDASVNGVVENVEKTATLNVKVTEEEAEEETVVADDSEIVVDVTEGIAVTADSKSARIATVAFNNFTDADVADAENNHVEFAFDKALAEKFSVEASVNAVADAKPVNVNVKVSGKLAEDVYNGTLTVTKVDAGVKAVETYDVEIAYTESKASEIKLFLSGVTGKVDLQGNYKDAAQVATAKFTAETKNGTPVPVEELVLCDGNKAVELNVATGTYAIAAVENGEITSSVKGASMDLAFYPTKSGKPANGVNTKGLAKKSDNFGKAWNTVYVAAKYTFVNEKGEAETVLTQPVPVANLKNTKSKLKADKINVAALKNNKDASLNVALTNKKVVTTYDLAGDSYILQYKGKDKKWTDDASANGAKVLYEEGNHVTLPVGKLYSKVGKNSVTARLVAFDSATGRVFPNQVINIKIAYKNKAKSYKVAPSVKTLTLNSDKKYNDASTNIVIDLKSNGAAIQSVKLDESKSSLKSISAKKGLKYSFDASSNKLTIVPGEIAGDKKYTNKLVFTLDASNNAVAFKDVKITVKTTNKPVKTTAKVKGKINTLLLTDASINDASKNNVVYVIPKLSNTYVSAYGEAGFSKPGKFVVTTGSYKGKFAYVVKAVAGAKLDKTTDLVAEGFYFYADGTMVSPTKAKVKASGASAKIKVFNYKGKKAGKMAKNPVLEVKDASFNRVDASYNGVAYVFMTYEKAVPEVEKITANNSGVKVELIQTAASKSIGAVTVRILVKEGTVLKPGKANKVKVTFPSKLTTKVKKVTFKLLDKRTAKAADKNKK